MMASQSTIRQRGCKLRRGQPWRWRWSPDAGERRSHLDHLVGVGVIEHELGEGGTAGWKENTKRWSRVIATHSLHREFVSRVIPQKGLIFFPGQPWEKGN